MNLSTIFSLIPWGVALLFVLAIGISVGVAILYGAFKSRIRVISIAACALVSFVVTLILKGAGSVLYSFAATYIEQLLQMLPQEYTDLFQSDSIQSTFQSMAVALAAPILFFLIFTVLRFLSWIVFMIVTLVNREKIKAKETMQKRPRMWAAIQGAVQGILIFLVIMTPIYSYERIAYQASKITSQQESGQESSAADQPMEIFQEGIAETDKNALFKMYGALLGDPAFHALTSFQVQQDGKTYQTDVEKELMLVTDFVAETKNLTSAGGIQNFDTTQGESIKRIAKLFEKSELLAMFAGEFFSQLADNWLNGQPAFGITKPQLGEVMDPSFEALLRLIQQDAKNASQLAQDINTVGEIFVILAEEDVFQHLGESDENTDDMIAVLTQSDLLSRVTEELKKNETSQEMVPELAKIGMRAVGSSIQNLSENADEIFDEYIGDVTAAINKVLSAGNREEQVKELTAALQEIIDERNLDIKLDESIIALYADVILDEMKGKTEVTEEDIQQLFEAYSQVSS